ncbi:MAG: ISAzo13-like element transposase-related protein [Nostoc sp.]
MNLRIRLIYYPSYHSKYNPIERYWAALENYYPNGISRLSQFDWDLIFLQVPYYP